MSNNDALQEAQTVYDKLFKGTEAAVESLPNYRNLPPDITKPAPRRSPILITPTKEIDPTSCTGFDCIDLEKLLDFPSSVGTKTKYIPPYPTASLPQHTSGESQSFRQTEMETARTNNWYDFSRLPPVHFAVHGNMSSPDVILNDYWCVRVEGITIDSPIPNPLPNSREDDFGVDDTNAGEYEIDLMEPTLRYVEKNWFALLSGYSIWDLGKVIKKLEQVVRLLIKIALDSTPDKIRFEILDPILAGLPIRKPKNDNEADFFPTKTAADSLHYVKPPWGNDFRNDDLMGWLQVAPTSPIYDHFSPYTEHQSNFPITNEMFSRIEGFENDDLDKAMRQKRLFIANYKQFEEACAAGPDAPYDYGARLYAPIALFALPKISGKKSLKIIAIQPTQDPSSHITTPADDYWTWQKAKNVVTTISSFSAVIDHLGAHMFMGRMPVGYYRCISNQHPLRSLLDTHMMSMVRNNFDGVFNEVGLTLQPGQDPFGNPENGLLSGLFDKISGIGSKHFLKSTLRRASELHFIDDSTPMSKKQRKKGDYRKITDHAGFDDDLAMPIIYNWVKDYLNLYYKSDSDVSNDAELQAFFSYVANEGDMKGFPSSAYSRAELTDTIARIIYWTSINHSLDRLASHIKLGALGYFGSLPNPTLRRKSTHQDWLNILPPINVGLATFSGSRIFVDIPRKWYRSLGKFPAGQFQHDPRVYKPLKRFQRRIKKLDNKLHNRNEKRKWAYELRMPSFLTVSPWN